MLSPTRRKTEQGNRFVAFAFAASEMVVEVDQAGLVTYAAGAFKSRLGSPPEAFVGAKLSRLVASCDQDTLELALALLQERGRLQPSLIRLGNKGCSLAVLSGLKLLPECPHSPICLTLGLPPAPVAFVSPESTARRLVAAAQSRMTEPGSGHVALVEVSGDDGGEEALVRAMEQLPPNAMASEVSPGRYGLLTAPGETVADMLSMLEAALHRKGSSLLVSSRKVALEGCGLTPSQAGRALRQALTAFARGGMAGLDKAGFGTGLASYVQGAMQQAGGLRQAIAHRDFTLLYQPIVSLQTRKLHHYEALLRPQRRMASYNPQDFVALTETAGVSDELDLAVVTMGCEAAERATAPIAVNVSGHSAQDAAFRERLLAILDASPAVRAGMLLVEMTETAQIETVEEIAETARCVRARGVKFCIDDFGAGAADIRLLRAVPTDVVKLDGSFVPSVLAGSQGRAFAAGMVEIAHASRAEVVAEKIETEMEAEAMIEIGASFGQGWLFGRPAPMPEPIHLRPARRAGAKESWG